MADNVLRRYIFASDFDQTLTFNDSGYVLAELVGISTEEFERKSKGMAKINLVQQGAELAYLLLHDPEFRAKVRKEHLREVGKRIRLKSDIKLLYQLLDAGIDGHQFDFFVLSAAPVEIVRSALEDIVPPDHIYGTEFRYKPTGESHDYPGDGGIWEGGGARQFVVAACGWTGSRGVHRRWQLGHSCHAAHQCTRRADDRGVGVAECFADREANGFEHERTGGAGSDFGGGGGMGALPDSGILRSERNADPGVGTGKNRLAYREAGGRTDIGG